MQKHEFEQLIGHGICDEDYEIVEKVYTWHPAITDVNGKKQIAQLYEIGGMMIIREMVDTAEIMIDIDREKNQLKSKLRRLEERESEILSCGISDTERVRKQAEIVFEKNRRFRRVRN